MGGLEDIEKIILVGGSSRIPKIKNIIAEVCPEKEILCNLNPDEAIAIGAAYQAHTLSGKAGINLRENVTINDVTAQNLGVVIADDQGNRHM